MIIPFCVFLCIRSSDLSSCRRNLTWKLSVKRHWVLITNIGMFMVYPAWSYPMILMTMLNDGPNIWVKVESSATVTTESWGRTLACTIPQHPRNFLVCIEISTPYPLWPIYLVSFNRQYPFPWGEWSIKTLSMSKWMSSPTPHPNRRSRNLSTPTKCVTLLKGLAFIIFRTVLFCKFPNLKIFPFSY